MKFSVELNCAPKQNTRFSSSLHIHIVLFFFSFLYSTPKLFCIFRIQLLICSCVFQTDLSVGFSFLILVGPVLFVLLYPVPVPSDLGFSFLILVGPVLFLLLYPVPVPSDLGFSFLILVGPVLFLLLYPVPVPSDLGFSFLIVYIYKRILIVNNSPKLVF